MEEIKAEEVKNEKIKGQGVGVPYPIETIDAMLEISKTLIDEYGSSKPITKEEISKTLNKKVASLSLLFSTMGQYGLFTLVHGKGYLPSDLYRRYTEPVHDNDEAKAKLAMFKSVPLYLKIIEQLNGHQLPADEKRFANLLKGDPYNVNPNSSDRAAKIFFENCRILGLRDQTGKFRFSDITIQANGSANPNKNPEDQKPPPPFVPGEPELFTLPIPLGGKRKAYLQYPLLDLSKKDIRVIKKALDFIESSILTDEEIEAETKKEQ